MGRALIIKGADFSANAVASNAVPLTALAINGATGTHTQRQVQLSVIYTPANTTQKGVTWSVVSGNATISSSGLLTYNGSSASGSVVVMATSTLKPSVTAQATLAFSLPAIEAPIFTPAAGTYNTAQSVALSCGTAGVTIYYTTDGSTPTTASNEYSSPITVNGTMTIKAIAVLNGQESEVAEANFIISTNQTVTINVTDGENAVSGATIVLSAGGTDYTPTSSSGGVYTFNVAPGTYTLSISKTGFIPHSESLTVSADASKTVELRSTNLLRFAILGNANCLGTTHKPILAAIAVASSDPNTYNQGADGAYVQMTSLTHSSILMDRNKATEAVTWQVWKKGDNYMDGDGDASTNIVAAAKAAYSLIEWPLDVDEIEIRLTNSNYNVKGSVMSKENTGIVQFTGAYDQGGANCVYRLNRTNYPNAFYVAIWMNYQSGTANWPNPTMETLGLSVTAIVS